jgi:hypothetical protein
MGHPPRGGQVVHARSNATGPAKRESKGHGAWSIRQGADKWSMPGAGKQTVRPSCCRE